MVAPATIYQSEFAILQKTTKQYFNVFPDKLYNFCGLIEFSIN